MNSFFATCRRVLVGCLGPPQRSSESSSLLSYTVVAVHPLLRMRGLPWSCEINMDHRTLFRPISVTWKETGNIFYSSVSRAAMKYGGASYKRPVAGAAGRHSS